MLLSLIIALMSWQAPPPAVVPAAPVTVMSFNIRVGFANDGENHWQKRRDMLFALLREQQADVIGLQEALHSQITEILEAVPGYEYVGVGRTDGRQGGEYSAILYRTARLRARRSDTFWLSDTPAVVRSRTWGNQYERICTWAYFEDREGPAFYVYNVHLDHESQPSRERSAALLLATIAARDPKAPVIITGDFNSGEDNPAAKAVRAVFRTVSACSIPTPARLVPSPASRSGRRRETRSTTSSLIPTPRYFRRTFCGPPGTAVTRRITSRSPRGSGWDGRSPSAGLRRWTAVRLRARLRA